MIWHISISWQSPPCVADSCESGPSRRCSHIPVIVHSRTGRLCSSATSHHTQPGCAASARPWGRWHRPGHSLPTRQGTIDGSSSRALRALPDVFWFWQERGRRRTSRGVCFPWHSGCCLRRKQVGRSVMREDSWQVQQRLTAKRRWQRGKK